MLCCTDIYEITVLVLRTLKFLEIRKCERTNERGWVITRLWHCEHVCSGELLLLLCFSRPGPCGIIITCCGEILEGVLLAVFVFSIKFKY